MPTERCISQSLGRAKRHASVGKAPLASPECSKTLDEATGCTCRAKGTCHVQLITATTALSVGQTGPSAAHTGAGSSSRAAIRAPTRECGAVHSRRQPRPQGDSSGSQRSPPPHTRRFHANRTEALARVVGTGSVALRCDPLDEPQAHAEVSSAAVKSSSQPRPNRHASPGADCARRNVTTQDRSGGACLSIGCQHDANGVARTAHETRAACPNEPGAGRFSSGDAGRSPLWGSQQCIGALCRPPET
jgi:hypothetical protein